MNIVFYGLVFLSFCFAVIRGTPEHAGTVSESVATTSIAADSVVKVDSAGEVEIDGVVWPAKVMKIEKGVATLSTTAPDGTAVVRFPEENAMRATSAGAMSGAKSSVDVAIGLAGAMTLFLGLMKVVEAAGGLDALARIIRPVMVRLFPDVPADHPAMAAMIMNIAANVLGLGNAATPFGIRAMQELDKLNKRPGTATNAMVLFLAINTSGVAVLPTGVMAMRAALGSHDPAAIFPTTILGTMTHTVFAVAFCKFVQRFFDDGETPAAQHAPLRVSELFPMFAAFGALATLVWSVYHFGETASAFIIPGLILGMMTVGVVKKVKIYETFIEGARDGFNSALRIVPYLVAILVSVGMFRGSGGMEVLVRLLGPVCNAFGMPPEVLPLAILRPLSGSGAFALTGDLTKTYGPDSLIGQMAGTLQGSTETTFYVLAVYFGAVGILRSRHAVLVGVVADLVGIAAAVTAVHMLIG